jgi:hypothetical protein
VTYGWADSEQLIHAPLDPKRCLAYAWDDLELHRRIECRVDVILVGHIADLEGNWRSVGRSSRGSLNSSSMAFSMPSLWVDIKARGWWALSTCLFIIVSNPGSTPATAPPAVIKMRSCRCCSVRAAVTASHCRLDMARATHESVSPRLQRCDRSSRPGSPCVVRDLQRSRRWGMTTVDRRLVRARY